MGVHWERGERWRSPVGRHWAVVGPGGGRLGFRFYRSDISKIKAVLFDLFNNLKPFYERLNRVLLPNSAITSKNVSSVTGQCDIPVERNYI